MTWADLHPIDIELEMHPGGVRLMRRLRAWSWPSRWNVMLLAVWLLGACGRLAFDPLGDAGLDTHGLGSIMVSVRGDTLAAAPVEGAYVFGDPFVSLVRTDAAGLALLPVAGETTVEVMYPFGGSAWRVYSALAQPPGTRCPQVPRCQP